MNKTQPLRDQEWTQHFTDSQLQEIAFCLNYVELFNHGTEGHNAKVIIAKLAKQLQRMEDAQEYNRAPPPVTDIPVKRTSPFAHTENKRARRVNNRGKQTPTSNVPD